MESVANAEVKIEDGILVLTAKADIVALLKDMALKSENSVDDMLVNIVEMAKNNLDWKGYAVQHLPKDPA